MAGTNDLSRLAAQSTFTAVGLMSGTSMDGVDAALVRMDGIEAPDVELLAFASAPYPEELAETLADTAALANTTAEDIARLDTAVGIAFANAAHQVCRAGGVEPSQVDFIGSHGQTVAHAPAVAREDGAEQAPTSAITGTLQMGAPGIIAALTGIPTVGDFRSADLALGGQGAPLAPYVDYLLRRSGTENRVILNIGGIANLTYLPAGCGPGEVVAFDTGPGNMVSDVLYRALYPGEGNFDAGGGRAGAGSVSEALVSEFMAHAYFHARPPKSAGHREFGPQFAWQFGARAEAMELSREDTMASAASLTVRSTVTALERFVYPQGGVDAVYVTGGGWSNTFIVGQLAAAIAPTPVASIEALGIPADAKEAVDFAVLARETLLGRPNVLANVTGAARSQVLGCIAPGGER